MSSLPHILEPTGMRPRSAAITATLIIVIPLALAAICFAARLDLIDLSHSGRAALLFAVLLALVGTGMPTSIALGPSVPPHPFILSRAGPKMAGLKVFTSIEPPEILAIPLFILARN